MLDMIYRCQELKAKQKQVDQKYAYGLRKYDLIK